MNFDEDLKDSLVFGAAISNYVGKNCSKILSVMRKKCALEEDFNYNVDKLF